MVWAVGIVVEITSIPEFLDVSAARFFKKRVVLRSSRRLTERAGYLFCGPQRSQIKTAGVCARSACDPGIVRLVRIAFVFDQTISIVIELQQIFHCLFHA